MKSHIVFVKYLDSPRRIFGMSELKHDIKLV